MTFGRLGYVIATVIQAISTFVFLALATRILGPTQYGDWALIEPMLLIGGQIATLGLSHGVIKLIAQDGRSQGDVISTIGRTGFFFSTVVALPLAIALGHFLKLGVYSLVLFVILVAEGRFILLASTLRGAGLSTEYTYLIGVRAMISMALMLLVLNSNLRIHATAQSLMLVWLAAVVSSLIFNLFRSRLRLKTIPRKNNRWDLLGYKNAIAYGAPILTSTVLASILANADRYVLASNVQAQDITKYVVAGKIAAILNLCVTPLNLWWPTARFQHINDKDNGNYFFSNAALLICSGLSIVCSWIYVFSPEIFIIFAPTATFDYKVTGILCISALFIALTAPLNIGGLKQGHTHWLVVSVGIAATVQIILTLLLVPSFGLLGAASATMLSSFLSLGFQNFISGRIHPISFKYFQMIGISLAWIIISYLIVSFSLAWHIKLTALSILSLLQIMYLKNSSAWPLFIKITTKHN